MVVISIFDDRLEKIEAVNYVEKSTKVSSLSLKPKMGPVHIMFPVRGHSCWTFDGRQATHE